MKIVNKSHWDAGPLKEIMKRCFEFTHYAKPEVVYIETTRKRYNRARISGYATLGPRYIRMLMPMPTWKIERVYSSDGKTMTEKSEMESPTGSEFAGVFIHESAHNQGMSHKDMRQVAPDVLKCEWGRQCGQGFQLALKPERAGTRSDVVAERKQRVEELIAVKEKKLKRMQKQLKKLYQKRKYYEKVKK